MTHILLIEDEQDLRQEISDILQFEGFAVTARTNGADGVLAALEIEPDLILSDIMMPQMDGIQVLQELRKTSRTRSIPLIFLTARGERAAVRQAMELGADDYLVKPFTHEELLAAVHARLEKQKAVQDIVNKYMTARQQFIRLIAHELRTPLTSISMVHDLLELYLRDYSDTEVQDLVASLGSGTHRLHRVVEQIICMVELESGLVMTRPTEDPGEADFLFRQDAAAIVSASIKLGRKLASQNRKLEILADVSNTTLEYTLIEGNISKLIYALGEVIANGLAFSKPEGQVQVRFRSDSLLAQFSIIDDGYGMSEGDIQRATQPFEQINRKHHEQQGLGLGLFLVNRIVQQHQGHLSIRSAINQGTEVTIRLPLKQRWV